MKHAVLVRNAFPREVEERLNREFEVVRVSPGEGQGIERLNAIEGVATNGYIKADKALMEYLPDLKIISTMSVGLDHIDLVEARERGVCIANVTDVLNECVADLAIGLVIASTRNIVSGDRYIRGMKWPSGAAPLGTKIGGKTLGVLGLGRIGSLVAARAEVLGMNIAYCNRRPLPIRYRYKKTALELAQTSDILVVIVPATKETENIVSAEFLEALGPSGYLINLSRGTIVDDDALIAALRNRVIAGAALDVFRNEPHVRQEYLGLENAVLTPHIGSATKETRVAMGMMMVDNLSAFFSQKTPPNIVIS